MCLLASFVHPKIPFLRKTHHARKTNDGSGRGLVHRAGTRGRVSELAPLFVVFLFSLSLSLSRARDVDNRLPSLGLDCVLLTPRVIIPTPASTDKTVRVAD